jgi:trehalose synthase
MHEVQLSPQSIDRYVPVVGKAEVQRARAVGEQARERIGGRVIWNVNSTAHGGGVVEILRTLLPGP